MVRCYCCRLVKAKWGLVTGQGAVGEGTGFPEGMGKGWGGLAESEEESGLVGRGGG